MYFSPVIWFALQTMPGFYIESYAGLKWVKREYSLPQIFSLVCRNVSKEVLLTEPKIHAKLASHSGDCVLGEGQCEHPLSNSEGFRDIQDSMSTVLHLGFHI